MPWDFKHKGYINPYEHGLMIIPQYGKTTHALSKDVLRG
jgi:hypothetical protein